MKAFNTFIEMQYSGVAPKIGEGCLYLLFTKNMVKIGATKRPAARITEQPRIGAYGKLYEDVTCIKISQSIANYRTIETMLKRAAKPALMFEPMGINGNSRPSEIFRKEMATLFEQAIRCAERGDIAGVFTQASQIERRAKSFSRTTKTAPRRRSRKEAA